MCGSSSSMVVRYAAQRAVEAQGLVNGGGHLSYEPAEWEGGVLATPSFDASNEDHPSHTTSTAMLMTPSYFRPNPFRCQRTHTV